MGFPCPRALGKADEGQSCWRGGEELGGFPACLGHRWASAALTGRDPHPMAAPAQPLLGLEPWARLFGPSGTRAGGRGSPSEGKGPVLP